MNAEEYTRLVEEAVAEDAKRDQDIQYLTTGVYDLTVAFGGLLEVVSTINKTNRGLMTLVNALQRSVRELQDQAQVPDAG